MAGNNEQELGRRGPDEDEGHTMSSNDDVGIGGSVEGVADDSNARAGARTLERRGPPGLEEHAEDAAGIARGKKRKSDEISRDARQGHPSPSSVALPAPSKTEESATSRNEAQSATAAHGERSMSPKGRSRGMSLRSGLFSKNMKRRTAAEEAGVEMSRVHSMADGFGANQKDMDDITTIAVSPSTDKLEKPQFSQTISDEATKPGATLRNYQARARRRWSQLIPAQRIAGAYSATRKFVLGINDIPPSKDGRHIPLGPSKGSPLIDDRTGQVYVDNFIKSSKYTIWNFLPRQLFAQFSKLANFYFLTVSILQMIPGLSTTGRYTTFVPLMFFVSLSMGKEGYEDYRRHRLDKAENNCMVNVLRSSEGARNVDEKVDLEGGPNSRDTSWTQVKWQTLRVGDIVKLRRNEPCPADVILLDSKGEHNVACIETMALDGETNLKNKQPPASLIGKCNTPQAISTLRAAVVVEDPNVDLYNLEGKVSLNDGSVDAPLTNNEVIYRGSILRNTSEAIGMVIYSGEECKIRMNANKNPRIKAPLLQSIVNKIVIIMVVFVLALSFSQAIAYQVWDRFEQKAWYLRDAHVAFGPLITSFILMFNTLIPLSLYVALEIVKVGQIIMLQDIDMYDPVSDTPFEAHTSTINEELGQVSYIFSDKTGTLTDNVMRFRKLSVAGTAWLHDLDLKKESVEERLQQLADCNDAKGKGPLQRLSRRSTSRVSELRSGSQTPRKSTTSWRSTTAHRVGQPELDTMDMIRYIQRRPHTAFARKASMMILAIDLCHTCIPEHGETEDELSYQASSPDELALVEAAKDLGYVAFHREMSVLTLKTYPNGLMNDCVRSEYKVLDVIEFSSQRKRMSVVVRFPDGRICIICKGADSVIMERLRLADQARRTVAEITRRVDERRAVGAQAALRRQSVASERKGSIISNPRPSLGFPRVSRNSMNRLAPVSDQIDGWLSERESEPTTPIDQSHYSPRPSMQLARHSSAFASGRSSYQQDHREDDLVEEALVMNESAVIERCFQHINDFATEGLRTLLYGHRFLDEEEYQAWKQIYSDATTSLTDRQHKIEAAGELIEQTLDLTGATAIEDKLQQGVPETIDRLRRANIKIWMLTGDKRETAINIGHACRLIKDYSALTILDHTATSTTDLATTLATATRQIHSGSTPHTVLIIDGATLATITPSPQLHTAFLHLATLASSLICCRASPSQKAALVASIRHHPSLSGVTLAIGDGANDTAMLLEAHVGIGLSAGHEGLHAARVSDYSIARFRFLSTLLLVHGRWNYIRTCKYVAGTFWKELLFYLTQAWFQRWNGYSGTSLYEEWSLSVFNTLFTSLPVIFLGVFEKDLGRATLLAVPELYAKGQRGAGFDLRVWGAWMGMAAVESCLVFFVMWGLYGRALFTAGQDRFSMGVLTYSVCVILINAKLQLIEQRWKSVLALGCVVVEVGGWFLWNIIFNYTYADDDPEMSVRDGFVGRFGRNALWWLALILALASCILLELGVRAIKAAFFPTDVELFQELEQDPQVRARFEAAAEEELRQGWELGRGESAEVERGGREVEGVLERAGDEERGAKGGVAVGEAQVVDGAQREVDVDEVFAQRYGKVKK